MAYESRSSGTRPSVTKLPYQESTIRPGQRQIPPVSGGTFLQPAPQMPRILYSLKPEARSSYETKEHYASRLEDFRRAQDQVRQKYQQELQKRPGMQPIPTKLPYQADIRQVSYGQKQPGMKPTSTKLPYQESTLRPSIRLSDPSKPIISKNWGAEGVETPPIIRTGGVSGVGGGSAEFYASDGGYAGDYASGKSLRGSSLSGGGGRTAGYQVGPEYTIAREANIARQKLQETADTAARQREKESFERRVSFAAPYLTQMQTPIPGVQTQGLSEAERIAIQAQEETAGKDIGKLQDVLSGAGILSSGSLAVGTGEILGAARAGIAGRLGEFAEGRAAREHQRLTAQRQSLMDLIQAILG